MGGKNLCVTFIIKVSMVYSFVIAVTPIARDGCLVSWNSIQDFILAFYGRGLGYSAVERRVLTWTNKRYPYPGFVPIDKITIANNVEYCLIWQFVKSLVRTQWRGCLQYPRKESSALEMCKHKQQQGVLKIKPNVGGEGDRNGGDQWKRWEEGYYG